MSVIFPDLLTEVRAFRAQHPAIRYVDLIALDIPGHFYGKRYPMDMLEKVAAGAPLKLPQNCVLLGTQGGLYPIGDYCFADGDPDAARRLVPGTLKPVRWEKEVIAQMLITSDGTAKPIEFEPREVLARVIQRLAKRGIRPVTRTTSRTCTSSGFHASRRCCTRWSMAPMSRACRQTSSPQSWALASSRSTSPTATMP